MKKGVVFLSIAALAGCCGTHTSIESLLGNQLDKQGKDYGYLEENTLNSEPAVLITDNFVAEDKSLTESVPVT